MLSSIYRTFSAGILLLLLVMLTGSLRAAPITFDFTGVDELPSLEKHFTAGGINLKVTGYNISASPVQAVGVGRRASGLGVRSEVGVPGDGKLDSINNNEEIIFEFSGPGISGYRLDHMLFHMFKTPSGAWDDFQLLVDSGSGLAPVTAANFTPMTHSWNVGDHLAESTRTGIAFALRVTQDVPPDDEDGFKIAALTLTPIPEPSSLLLLGVGGLGLTWRLQRRGKKAAR